jgi:hypothetical protein
MSTSSASHASTPLTRSEWVSTLPLWRRLLATFNWRPVYDIEQRELESRKRTRLLEIENRRLAALESRLDALLLNADSSSQTPPATGSN